MSRDEYKPRILKLAGYNQSILRRPTKPVQFPLSEEDKHTIADMIYSIQPEQLLAAGAPWDAASGMAANQWGIDKSIFLYAPNGTENGVEVVINPSYEAINIPEPSKNTEWEGCFSIPLATGHILRDLRIRVKYQNEQGEVIEKELSGWPARVWQHENDHLKGYLYDSAAHGKCLEKKVFRSLEEVDNFYDKIREERRKQG